MRDLVLSCLLVLFLPNVYAGAISDTRRAELLHLLKHDCGACHGMRLTGGLGPPLTPAALAEKPPELLLHAILEGREGTPMPPWRGILSTDEASWLVDVLTGGLSVED